MSSGTPTRQLTLPSAAALVVGQVIAVGIFLTPGTIIRRMLTALTALKIALIAGLVAIAFISPAGAWRRFRPFTARPAGAAPLAGALAGALIAAFFSFGGWWEVTKNAGEVRDPGRTLPRAPRLGLGAVTNDLRHGDARLHCADRGNGLRVRPARRVV